MKRELALRLYNLAERKIKKDNPDLNFIQRAELITELLTMAHGEVMSDEIIDLVFDDEC